MTSPAAPWLTRADLRSAALLVALSLCLQIAIAVQVTRATAMPLSWLAAFFDGYLYLDIARSFPLPFSPEGRDYLGQAPGYPALIYLARQLTPLDPVNWGALALATSWLSAALCAGAFHLVCRAAGIAPFWPSVAFVVANPRWLSVAATAHPEGLAMLFVLLTAAAQLRGRTGWAVLWLSLAGLTRFPALLIGAALAFDLLFVQRRRDRRTLALLSLPLLAFAAHNLYLFLRIPGYAGMGEAHSVFWDTHLTWPFAALLENALAWLRGTAPGPNFALTYASVTFYVVALALGLREREPRLRFLVVWVGAIVLFHVSLAGEWGGFDFARLAILAWPAALLLVWRRVRFSAPPAAAAAGWAVAGALSAAITVNLLADAVRWQRASYPWPVISIRRLEAEQPFWFDFGARYRSPGARGAPGEASP
ncbi:MAG TPA: hypothetical protein VII72_17135 [Myxococcota bacterium]